MRRLTSIAAAVVLVGACGPQVSILLGPTPVPARLLHEVDGVTMMDEQPCDDFADCALIRGTAAAALGIPPSSIADTHLAQTGPIAGGFWAELAVVFDLVGGERRAVVVDCGAYNAPPVTCGAQPRQPAGG